MRALGLGDGEAAVDRFLAARGGARFLSCDAFCEAAAAELDRARGAEPELLKLLALFDDGGSGTLDRETLRHLLCDFASPERLTPDEFDELDLGTSVDYRAMSWESNERPRAWAPRATTRPGRRRSPRRDCPPPRATPPRRRSSA